MVATSLEIRNLIVKAGDFTLEVNELVVEKGEYLVVLGPSGVGKTVLLYTIAGFIKPRKGRVLIDGKDVTDVPPEKREVAIVPQNYALFTHMTVYENIAYGLRARGADEDIVDKVVHELARELEIEHLLHRRADTLSGGEQQRVALARALAIKPKIMLLDEPTAALDPRLRYRARELIKRIHERHRFTAIHVTHDIAEALELADRMCYMEGGKVLWVGSPDEAVKSPYIRPYIESVEKAYEALKRLTQ